AMSSTRVMATCATIGQAVGTAAAIAIRERTSPRGVYQNHIAELKQTLMDDDSFLPFNRRQIPELSAKASLAASSGDPEPLRNGYDRPTPAGEKTWDDNSWSGTPGQSWVEYAFAKPSRATLARIIFDSDLNRKGKGPRLDHHAEKNILSNFPLNQPPRETPPTLVKAFRLEARNQDGTWSCIHHQENNYQRLVKIPLDVTTTAIRLVPEKTWGSDTAKVFSFDLR
ncbi:MAG TPA: FAD-dependent oxidoreductase, partial [Lentisphaeria bacterium]|nr:FAD-dependent oxidoreductase [Lentisphaeria bacterium]